MKKNSDIGLEIGLLGKSLKINATSQRKEEKNKEGKADHQLPFPSDIKLVVTGNDTDGKDEKKPMGSRRFRMIWSVSKH